MTQGVVYFLCGNWHRYIGPLVVSLHSLRKWYDGEVCILMAEDTFAEVFMRREFIPLFHDGKLEAQPVPLADVPRHRHYVTKASLWRHSPYEQTVLLDADTVVTGDISQLFVAPLTLTQFAGWVTTGTKISGRLRQWQKVCDENPGWKPSLDYALSNPLPHINTGVVGWNSCVTWLRKWEHLSTIGYHCSFTDEYAMQILATEMTDDANVALLDDRFNCSPTYGVHRDDARIWHYHGRRMVPGRGKLKEAAQYRPHLMAAIEANAGGIADWLGEVDAGLYELVG